MGRAEFDQPGKRKKDGSQYLYLTLDYFDRRALGGISLSPRLLLKHITIECVVRRSPEQKFSHTFLKPARFASRSLTRWFDELEGVGLVSELRRGRQDHEGSLYRVSDALIGASKQGINWACAPYRVGKDKRAAALSFLTPAGLFLFECISCLAWDSNSLRLKLTVNDLVEFSGLSAGTVKRERVTLARVGLIGCEERYRPHVGNEYLVNPMLIWGPKREKLAALAAAQRYFHSDHFGGSCAPHSDHFGGSFGSFWRVTPERPGTNGTVHSDHFGGGSYCSIPFLLDGAARYCPKKPAGGVPEMQGKGQEGVLTDMIEKLGKKGVALPGDDISVWRIRLYNAKHDGLITIDEYEAAIAQLDERARVLAAAPAPKPRKKKASVEGEKSNFHAQPEA